MRTTTFIYCCNCERFEEVEKINGLERYPGRIDLEEQIFWKCLACGNAVGCHKNKGGRNDVPLGVIPSPEIASARQHIHKLMDPLWQERKIKRGEIYKRLSVELGYSYHTAEISTIEEARAVYRILLNLKDSIY